MKKDVRNLEPEQLLTSRLLADDREISSAWAREATMMRVTGRTDNERGKKRRERKGDDGEKDQMKKREREREDELLYQAKRTGNVQEKGNNKERRKKKKRKERKRKREGESRP